MDPSETGIAIDAFTLGERLHAGRMGSLYEVSSGAPFPSLIKLPQLDTGEDLENLIAYEVESMVLPALRGPHVPRFVAAGDPARRPYLVLERIPGESLQARMDRGRVSPQDAAQIGAAIADALHALHLQEAIHLDLKPDNVMLTPEGRAVLVDFGLAHHAHFPDLLSEESRFAAGSAPYVSPEQVCGVRSDPRSDLFALGAVLYEMITGELPFGAPQAVAALRDRLWREPVPPSVRVAAVEPWLQEIILRCLEVNPELRYQSAAHVAFDLRHPEQVRLTERAHRTQAAGFIAQVRRWWRWRNAPPPSAGHAARSVVEAAPVILAAVDTLHPDDERHPAIRRAIAQVLRVSRDFRLVCLAVIPAGPGSEAEPPLEHLARLRRWVEPFGISSERLSLHVVEGSSAEQSILDFARRNHAALIVLGAPQPDKHAFAWWRSVASGVTAGAPCSVHVVRAQARG